MAALPKSSHQIPGSSSLMRNCALLTLTLGHQTGWAMQKHNGDISHGVMPFKALTSEGEGMAFLRFRYWLDEMAKKAGALDAIIYQDVQVHANSQLSVEYGGFYAHVTAWCEWRALPYIGAAMSDVRKLVIGDDKPGQQTLIDALRRRGYITATNDTAGALALLDWALRYKSRGNA